MSRISICVKGKILRGTTKEESRYATIIVETEKKEVWKMLYPKDKLQEFFNTKDTFLFLGNMTSREWREDSIGTTFFVDTIAVVVSDSPFRLTNKVENEARKV